ncbi:zinc finger protein ZAT9-like [Cornus florida]|uniref:zinc finger protein ZAT9-like n=1 Tax=Cornus florida TaxID=4283 RepID=UPI00289E23DC|nr:zinc finger protein ZAT9-like [Cornus florida]
MERHKCKICTRSFSNGRALGGHMRSHLTLLTVPPKIKQHHHQLSGCTESASFLVSSSEEEERESEDKSLAYGLRENPKKSFRVVDPEFLDAGLVVQDRESETESTRNPTRQRSKRTRKAGVEENQELEKPKLKKVKPSSTESMAEVEPVSSVSDTSPEEDVALCLMMLSRDSWSSDHDSGELKPSQKPASQEPSQGLGRYQCETCNRVFKSFQALGGHRTSHKKAKNGESGAVRRVGSSNVDQKVHECPFCGKVFGSGQALGGHKRSHFLGSSSITTAKFGDSLVVDTSNSTNFGDSNLIDLNLPAPMEEDEDFNQLDISAISDAEFINPNKH